MNLREKTKELMLKNYEATGKKYICPSWPHYQPQWLWDSCFHSIICSELGLFDLAKNEIRKLLKHQRKDGWIPHMISEEKDIVWRIGAFYPEKRISAHTQPPVMARAVEAINDPKFTREILPSLIKFYLYFSKKQDPDKDGIISVCHPHETGRDSSLMFSPIEWKFSSKLPNLLNVGLDFLSRYWLEYRYKKVDWDIEKIWKLDLCNIEDLMFHCIWVDGLYSLERMIENTAKKEEIRNLANKAENAVFELCWDEKDRIFYSLNSKNQKIKRVGISNLFPLILNNIPEKMHKGLVEHLTNPEEFWTPYPISTASKNDPEFDPHSAFYCNWRGPVWINTNWFLIKGLMKHGYSDIAKEVTRKTKEMIEREGFREFYDPFTGKGLRKKSRNFGWSGLIVAFPETS